MMVSKSNIKLPSYAACKRHYRQLHTKYKHTLTHTPEYNAIYCHTFGTWKVNWDGVDICASIYIYTYKCKHSDVHVAHTSSLSSALVEKLGRFTADSQHITAEAHLKMCTDTPTPTHTHIHSTDTCTPKTKLRTKS